MPKIRPITPTDIPIVFCIESQIHTHPWTENMFQDCFKPESENLGYAGFVLETTQKICAYLIIQTILDEYHILTIGVEKEYQNKGYATQLLQHLFNHLKNNNIQRILLEVRESNLSAIHLYKKLGFKCIAERKNYYKAQNNEFENALIFEL